MLTQRMNTTVVFLMAFAGCIQAEDHTDVTPNIIAAIKGNKVSILADNETFGDTVPGTSKKLHVEYSVGDQSLQRDVKEGERLEIAAPAGQKLVIKKATYGSDGEKIPAPPSATPADLALLDTLPGFK